MAELVPDAADDLPPVLVLGGSLAAAAHLVAVAALALAAPSGPWATPFGVSAATEPQFAHSISEVVTRRYLAPLKLAHNNSPSAHRPALPGVYFEVRLKDEAGSPLAVVRFPEDSASFWVRHRQTLLAQALADDQPVEPRGGEVIAAPQQQLKTVAIWDIAEDRSLKLRPVAEHLVPRDRPVFRPSEWSLVLARSYVRYLCRLHGAASAELVRHTREPILPAVMFMDEPPPGAFDELVANFGEVSR